MAEHPLDVREALGDAGKHQVRGSGMSQY
jgi:hypothetical protein